MKKLLTLLVVVIPAWLFAQKNMILYNMNNVPQSVYANPAFIPNSRINVSLPVIGGTNLTASRNDFETDVFTENGNRIVFDANKFVNGLDPENFVSTTLNLDMFHIGFAAGRNYFHLNATERFNMEVVFPKEAAILLSEVYNSDNLSDLFGQNVNIQNFGINQFHIREIGVGWGRIINQNLTVGAKYKFLYGVSSVQTKTSAFILDTDISSLSDTLSGFASFDLNTSGVNDYWEGNYANLVVANRNFGHAIDLGASYELNERYKFSVAILDLFSGVTWKTNVRNYRTDGVAIELSPVSVENIRNRNDSSLFQSLGNLVDSLGEQLEIDPTFESYETDLPTRVNLYAGYFIAPKLEVGLLSQNLFYRNTSRYYLKAQINARLKRFLQAQFSYALLDEDEATTNIGLGLALNLGFLQFYVMSENVLAPVYYHDNLNPTVMFGLNLTFGRDYQ
jgi:hypothetical protein